MTIEQKQFEELTTNMTLDLIKVLNKHYKRFEKDIENPLIAFAVCLNSISNVLFNTIQYFSNNDENAEDSLNGGLGIFLEIVEETKPKALEMINENRKKERAH